MRMKIYFLLSVLLFSVNILGQKNTDGVLEINFPNQINGTIVLTEIVFEGRNGVDLTVDSGRVDNGKYVFKYKHRDVNTIQARIILKDSIKPIGIFVKNLYHQGVYSDALALDNHHAIVTIDSLFSVKDFQIYRGTINGSPETDMDCRLSNELFNEKLVERFTDPKSFFINKFDIIKENPGSEILLKKIYDDRDYYKLDTLKMVLSFFDNDVKNSAIGKKVNLYIKNKILFSKDGIRKNFVFYDANSKKYSFDDCLNGKSYALIVFWASWCGPCVREIPWITELYNRFKDQVAFVSLSVDSEKDKWIKALAEHPMGWLNLAGFPESKTKVMDVFSISFVPCFLVVDKTGKLILDGIKGYDFQNKDGVQKKITINNLDEYFNDILTVGEKK
jgi:thiol-disulfide isomerase/thioredoxin